MPQHVRTVRLVPRRPAQAQRQLCPRLHGRPDDLGLLQDDCLGPSSRLDTFEQIAWVPLRCLQDADLGGKAIGAALKLSRA